MPNPSYWQSRLLNSIRDREMTKRLRWVFDAEGCREGWLQGELFLSHRKRVGVNLIPIAGRRTKADLSADLDVEPRVRICGPHPMVAELKVLAASFQPKTITGGAIKPFRRLPEVNGRRRVTKSAASKSLSCGSWGLIPDYRRLLEAKVPPRTEKLLVLVALTDVDEQDNWIGAELESVDFQAKSFVGQLLGNWGFVRIWRV
jgi:hypothetical protein